jgi:hypothetical protein
MPGSRNHVRTVLRDSPVCLHISLIGSLSRKYKRLILAKVPTLITPASPVHNFDIFERTDFLTGVKFGWKISHQWDQIWMAFNKKGTLRLCAVNMTGRVDSSHPPGNNL